MELYQRIKARREELGMSQNELAKRLGYKDRSTIAKIEAGINDITQSKIEAFAKALNTTASDLMGWDESSGSARAAVESNADDFSYVQYAGPGKRRPEDFFIASVDGNSMYPHYQHGDDILCLRCTDMEHSGRVGIIVFGDGEATLKKIEYTDGEDWIDLVPFNPEYTTKRIDGADLEQCRVVGRVIRVIRSVDDI